MTNLRNMIEDYGSWLRFAGIMIGGVFFGGMLYASMAGDISELKENYDGQAETMQHVIESQNTMNTRMVVIEKNSEYTADKIKEIKEQNKEINQKLDRLIMRP